MAVNRHQMSPYLLLLPMLLLYILFIGGGIWQILRESIGYISTQGLTYDSGRYFQEILEQQSFLLNLSYSLYLALTASFLSMVLGIITAYCYFLSEDKKLKKYTSLLLRLGLMIPYLFVIVFAMIFLGKTGLLSRFLYQMGMITDFTVFPTLIFNPWGIGILWVTVFKGTPFVAVFVMNHMGRISGSYAQVAKTLGARDIVIFKKIYLPLCARTIVWTTVVLFAYNLGSFEVPYLLSAISPLPLASQLYSLYSQFDYNSMHKAMAMSVIILVSGALVGGGYSQVLYTLIRGQKK